MQGLFVWWQLLWNVEMFQHLEIEQDTKAQPQYNPFSLFYILQSTIIYNYKTSKYNLLSVAWEHTGGVVPRLPPKIK